VQSAANPVASPQAVTITGATIVVAPAATSQEVGALGMKLDAFMGEVRSMKKDIADVRKDVGLIRKDLRMVRKDVDKLLSAVGPDSGWAKAQKARQAEEAKKTANLKEKWSHLSWLSNCANVGEVHLRLNRRGMLEGKLVGLGQTEWSSTDISNGRVSVAWGNYILISNDAAWLMSEVQQYHYTSQDE